MTDLRRPGHTDAAALIIWNAGLGLYGGALAGTLTGALFALWLLITDGVHDVLLLGLAMAGTIIGLLTGILAGLATGVVLSAYVSIRHAGLRHQPGDIAPGFPAVTLVVVVAVAVWVLGWIDDRNVGPRGGHLGMGLWFVLPGTVMAAITGWLCSRLVAKLYLELAKSPIQKEAPQAPSTMDR